MAEVRDNPVSHRFEVWVDADLAGFADYQDADGVRTFVHTKVDPAFEGRGLATELIRAALDRTRAAGLEIVPVCPFVKAYIAREAVPDEQ